MLYKFLLFDPQYRGLHVKSKAMYMLIVDTMIYRMNKDTIEVDRNGYQYIEFETDYFKKMLKISVNTITKFKKELIKVGLIDVTSKTGKQRLYVYMPKIEDKQFYYYNKETKSNKYTYIELPKFLFEAAYQSISSYQK
ncbi:replication initiator protein A [Staphylococcus sp. 8AQ]|uniref:replication initiator protein A n=2 Tax=Staphylococcus TaxID=1279 RepID=UPI0022A70CB0|nr:replication initiator protein A [Staphylococcus sp. 8AQ]